MIPVTKQWLRTWCFLMVLWLKLASAGFILELISVTK